MTGEFKIEQGVPLSSRSRYPFATMAVGESFFVATENGSSRVATASRTWSQRHKEQFSSRRVEGGVRIWRVS